MAGGLELYPHRSRWQAPAGAGQPGRHRRAERRSRRGVGGAAPGAHPGTASKKSATGGGDDDDPDDERRLRRAEIAIMKWMGWDESQLHSARSSTIAEIAALMREGQQEDDD